MLPEQVWDDVGRSDVYGFVLAWTHAEYVKLVRSLVDGGFGTPRPSCVPAMPPTRRAPSLRCSQWSKSKA